jgi:hypothetical protein
MHPAEKLLRRLAWDFILLGYFLGYLVAAVGNRHWVQIGIAAFGGLVMGWQLRCDLRRIEIRP